VKERLTGAIILVVLIVLLVPELLSGPSRSAPAPQAATPSTEEPPLRSYTINLADDAHSTGAAAGTSSASAQASGPEQPTPIAESATAGESATTEAPTAGESPTASQSTDSGRGSATGGSPNASPARQTPPDPQAAANAPNDSWQQQPKAAPPHGPTPQQQRPAAPDRAASQQRLAQADRATADRAQTERSQAERSPPAERGDPGGSSSASGWMVQLGVFSIQANAERLAQELKSQGFHAFVSENGGGGRPLWRVRAGPVAEHAAAEQLNAKLRAAGHAGSVVPK
jgi:cell division septation protein DedD